MQLCNLLCSVQESHFIFSGVKEAASNGDEAKKQETKTEGEQLKVGSVIGDSDEEKIKKNGK